MSDSNYDVIIGLEVHVQLATQSKLFCRCSTRFGAPPNTQTCPVCIGMPGVLPVMNRDAYRLALKTAVALNCTIPESTKWDRKQYFYPDLPKGYQISQFDLPMSADGHLAISDDKDRFPPKKVGITRAHLEEDAGKSMHDEAAGKADSRIDLNRTGTPLLEIVSEPDMRSPEEARAYLDELKLLLTYIDVSDCNMQEGSLRVDANINLHVVTGSSTIATPIVEIKNLNSFRAVERALAYEIMRQYDDWQETGHTIDDAPKTTRGWDDQSEVTRAQRSKEGSSDYRYYPDPDLIPVVTAAAEVDAVRQSLPELPATIRARLQKSYGISAHDANVLVKQGRPVVDYYSAVADACSDGKQASNWVQRDVLRLLKEDEIEIDDFPIPPQDLAGLVTAVKEGALDSSRASEVFQEMYNHSVDTLSAMQTLGIEKVDQDEIADLCRELLAANPSVVSDIQNGKQKAIGSLIGQAKKKNPNANPNQVRQICLDLISEM